MSLFQSNLRKQIRKLPKFLKLLFVKINKLFSIIQNYSLHSLVVGQREADAGAAAPPRRAHREAAGPPPGKQN